MALMLIAIAISGWTISIPVINITRALGIT